MTLKEAPEDSAPAVSNNINESPDKTRFYERTKSMNRSKNIFLLLFFILAAVVIGGLVAFVTQDIAWLKWLTYSDSIGVNYGNNEPLLDLGVFRFKFGLEMNVSVLQIILICVALFIYRKVR